MSAEDEALRDLRERIARVVAAVVWMDKRAWHVEQLATVIRAVPLRATEDDPPCPS